jgi:hypothetical protein
MLSDPSRPSELRARLSIRSLRRPAPVVARSTQGGVATRQLAGPTRPESRAGTLGSVIVDDA